MANSTTMKISTPTALVLFVGASLALCACSVSGGGNPGTSGGAVTFSITDGASDDIESFVVEVDALRLTDSNAAVVSVLSSPVKVDLAALSDLSQILNYATLPAGTYTQAEITLDFTNASCILVGQGTPAAIVDTNGLPLTGQVVLPMQLGSPLQVSASRHAVLEFEFALDQSVAVDAPLNTLTVEPSFVLRVDPTSPKALIAIGRLKSVNSVAHIFSVQLETLGGVQLARVDFAERVTTTYQLNGTPYVGLGGGVALGTMPMDTWTQVYAQLDPLTGRMDAIGVEAGSGTYNGGQDIVEGWVTDRSTGAGASPILTVVGHSNNAAHDAFQFNTTFTVATNITNTKVDRCFSAAMYNTDDINVGQLVRVFGALVGTNLDASTVQGVIRLQPTRVFGYAAGAPVGGVLTIDLNRVSLRSQTAFVWADSGTTPPDPLQFKLGVGTLGNGLGIAAGSAIEARGYFAAVDSASADFNTTTLIDLDDAPSLFVIKDRVADMTVTTTATAPSIVFDLTGVAGPGELAILDHGFVGVTQLPTAPSPMVVPANAATLCVLRDVALGTVDVYLLFDTFSGALAPKLAGGGRLAHFGALGTYDPITNAMSAYVIVAVVE
jgi:hypothetical protein